MDTNQYLSKFAKCDIGIKNKSKRVFKCVHEARVMANLSVNGHFDSDKKHERINIRWRKLNEYSFLLNPRRISAPAARRQ